MTIPLRIGLCRKQKMPLAIYNSNTYKVPLYKHLALMKAVWNNQVIAESDNTIVVENNHYFPKDSVKPEFLRASSTHTTCPWKGIASYYTIEVDGKQNQDAAWYYAEPKAAAANITNYVAFWKGVQITN